MTEPLGYSACLTKDFVFEGDGMVLCSSIKLINTY